MIINGLNVYENMYALEKTNEPIRVHKLKPWHCNYNRLKSRLPYHDRIQKKWIKRWGYVMKPCIFQTPQGLIVHPSLMPELRKQFEHKQNNRIYGGM